MVHRGPVHTPMFAEALFIACWYAGLDHTLCVALLAGYLSHLLTDSPTKMGIAWLWPIYQSPIRLPLTWRSGRAMIEWPLALSVVTLSVLHIAM